MTSWQKVRLRLKLKYRLRREYFTILVPIVLALLLVSFGFASGYLSLSSTSSSLSSREAAYQRIIEEMNQAGGNGTVNFANSSLVSTQIASNQTFRYELVLISGAVIAVAPYSIDVTLVSRRRRRREEDFSNFLFELSELVRGGIDPARAVSTLATGNLGSITKNVRLASKQMQMGYTFEEAMDNLGESCKSDLIKRYTDLAVQASYSGGSVSSLIQRASADLKTFLSIDAEKRAGLGQYTMILYFSQVILIAIAIIMVNEFIPGLAALSNYGTAGLGGIFGTSDLSSVPIQSDLFYLVVINGVLGGLVIGKISEGSVKAGLKHSLVLLVICFVAWNVFVVSASNSNLPRIQVVSVDTQGYTGIPLATPLVVNVTDSHGNLLKGQIIKFTVSGDGSANPGVVVTDSDGLAQTQITLGDKPGLYQVQVTDGQVSITIPIEASSG